MAEVDARFAAEAESQAQALRGLGIDARVGEVPGEYCPGRFSVNARGQTKLIGAAQRIISGAWLFSTVVVVGGAARVRAVLEEVYAALALDWDPASVGSIADEVGAPPSSRCGRRCSHRCQRATACPSAVASGRGGAAARDLLGRHRAVPGAKGPRPGG